MKEKLQALLEVLRAKLDPFLAKLDPFLTKFRGVFSRIAPHLGQKARWLAYTLLLPSFLCLLLLIGFFLIYPAYELRPWVAVKLQNQLNAQQVKISEMRWDHSLIHFSLGVRLEGVEIRKGAWFENIGAEKIRLSIEPWGLLFGGTPFNIEVEGLLADAKLRAAAAQAPLAEHHDPKSKILNWTKNALTYIRGYHLHVTRGELRLSSDDDPSIPDNERIDFFLKDMNLKATLSSSWTQEVELDALVQAGSPSVWALAGPIHIESSSALNVEGGTRLVGISFNKFEADLGETSLSALGIFERIGGGVFQLSATPKVIFDERDSEIFISKILLNAAKAKIDDLEVSLNVDVTPRKETEVEWTVGRSEVKNLHLPFKGLRRAPGKGIVSTSGKIILRNRIDTSEATWRLMLNNFRIDSSYLSSVWGDKSSVKGEFRISAVSEGEMRDGKIDSPRSELQMDATEVSWAPPDSSFIKPSGSKAHFLMRMKHEADKLTLEQFDLELHTLKLELSGEANNLLNVVALNETAEVALNFRTNNVNLSEWTSLFPNFRKVPLQGFFEAKGSISSQVSKNEKGLHFDNSVWSFDKLQLSNIKGSVADNAYSDVEGLREDIDGPFEASLFFVGRGRGSRVDQARLLAKLDLTGASVHLHKKLRKPKDVPLTFEISADQSRNQVNIERGAIRFSDLDLAFTGSMVQGMGRSRLELKMARPINLAQWKDYVLEQKLRDSLKGTWKLNGGFGLDSDFQSEKDIDWSTLTFEGELALQDLAWHSELFGNFDRLSGRLKFSDDSLGFSSFEMKKGNQTYKLDGTLRPRKPDSPKNKSLHVSDFFSDTGWDLTANMEVPKIEATQLLKKMDSVDRYSFPDSWIDGKRIQESKASVNLSLGELSWENKVFLKSVLGKIEYTKGRWTLRPFSALYGSSKVQGSASLDLTPTWQSDSDPQWAASIKTTTLSSKDFPIDLGLEGENMTADLTLTSQGRYFSDWKKNLRVRGNLGMKQVKKSMWVEPLKEMLEDFFEDSDARDYLLSDAKRAICEPVVSGAYVEVQWIDGAMKLERMRQTLTGKGRFDLEALLVPEDNVSRVKGKAAFHIATECLSARAKGCFDSLGAGRGWPLDFSSELRSFKELRYGFDVDAYAKSFKTCMARSVSEKVARDIKN